MSSNGRHHHLDDPLAKLPLFVLLIMVSLPPVANMWPSPALEKIAGHFDISVGHSSLMLSVFVLGYALSQLIYGPLANAIGRKRTLFFGMTIGLAGSVISMLSVTYFLMLAGRFIMAFGVGAGLTLILTMIGDVYSDKMPEKGLQVSAFCFAAIITIPGIGTLVSSQILIHIGWRTGLAVLSFYTLLSLLLVLRLPETLPVSKQLPLHPKQIVMDYLETLKQSELYSFILVWSVANFLLYTLYTSLPLIITVQLNQSPALFGVIYLCLSIGLLISNLVNSFISKLLSVRALCAIGVCLVFIGMLAFLWVSFFSVPQPWHLFFAVLLIFLGLPVLMSTGSACTIQRAKNRSVGSSMASFIAMMFSFIGSVVFSLFQEPLLGKEAVITLVSSVLFLLLLLVVIRQFKHR